MSSQHLGAIVDLRAAHRGQSDTGTGFSSSNSVFPTIRFCFTIAPYSFFRHRCYKFYKLGTSLKIHKITVTATYSESILNVQTTTCLGTECSKPSSFILRKKCTCNYSLAQQEGRLIVIFLILLLFYFLFACIQRTYLAWLNDTV
jgi:hypothetical protein